MEAEDVIPLAASDSENDKEEGNNLSCEVSEGKIESDVLGGENMIGCLDDTEVEEGQFVSVTAVTEHVTDLFSVHEEAGLNKADDTVIVNDVAKLVENHCASDIEVEEGQLIEMNPDENGCESIDHGSSDKSQDSTVRGPLDNGCETEHAVTDGSSMSGVKRTRATLEDEQQHPSVHVNYFGLSRQSKQKLEELLREWSEWHARNASQTPDELGVIDSGEEIYFPALNIGKTSSVTFWMENGIRKPEDEDFIPKEDASVPFYDRGFALGLTSADGSSNLEGDSELLDAPRCFNCSSYSHSLRGCPKPRDNDAVNNSRKQLKSKRNQTTAMRNVTRYYQDSPGGKYEGLRPGVLNGETRRLLGLGESDPPPWLNRMREIGYPPGYLVPEDEDLPSGISIFAGDEIKEETEDGEILGGEITEVPRKMSVKFPGINDPIPKNADEIVWAARPSNSDRHRNGESNWSNRSADSYNRGRRFREHNYRDEDQLGDDRASSYTSRYDDYDFSPTSRSLREDTSGPRARSTSYGKSTTGYRGRSDPSDSEESLAYRLYSSFSYDSGRRISDNGNSGHEPENFSRRRDRDDRHRHRSGR